MGNKLEKTKTDKIQNLNDKMPKIEQEKKKELTNQEEEEDEKKSNKEQSNEKGSKIDQKEEINNTESMINNSLISYQNEEKENIQIQNIENDEKEDKLIIDEKETNIFVVVNVLYSQYRNSNYFQLFFGEKPIEVLFSKKIDNYLVLFYHIIIKDEEVQDKSKFEDKIKIYLYLDKFHAYYTTIKYLYNHINFFYDIEWDNYKNIDGMEMPEIVYNPSYLFFYFYKFLTISEVSNLLIEDMLEIFYNSLNKKKIICFEDLVYVLLLSYKNKNENLIHRTLDLFENKKIQYFRKIDTKNLLKEEDLEEYLFKEDIKEKKEKEQAEQIKIEDIKNEIELEEEINTDNINKSVQAKEIKNNDKEEDKYKFILEKIKINIIIRYAHHRFDEYFSIIRNNKLYINYLFQIIEKENENDNKNFLIREIIFSLFEIIENKEQLKIILKQCSDISLFMNVINSYFLLITKIIENTKKISIINYINIGTLSLNKEYFVEFIQGFSQILNEENLKDNIFFDFDNVIEIYLKKISRIKDLEKCQILSNVIDKYKHLFSQNIINSVNQVYHDIFLFLVERKIINNENLLDIISSKDKYFYEKKYESKKYRPLEIFDNISIFDSEIFFENFRQKKIWNYFLIYDMKLIKYFLDKIPSLSYLNKIFLLFPKELFGTIFAKSAILISEKFEEFLDKRSFGNYDFEGLKQDFLDIMEILTISKNSCKNFLKNIEKFKKNKVNSLYLEIIGNQNFHLSEESFQLIINYLSVNLSDSNTINNETIFYILEKARGKEEFVKSAMNFLGSCSLKKENFISENNSINYKIFKFLSQFGYFNKQPKWFVSSDYYQDTIEGIQDIQSSIKSLKIYFTDFNSLFINYGDMLLQNLIFICLGNENQANELYQKLDTEKKNLYQLQTTLNELLNCYKCFFPISKKNDIEDIIFFQNSLSKIKLCELNSYNISRKKNSFLNDADKYSKLFALNNSFFFMTLYRGNKAKISVNRKDSEEEILKATKKDYDKLKILFNDKENAKKLDALDLFYEELRKAESRIDIVRKEINFLKSYFQFEHYISTDLENYIILYLSKEDIKKSFLGIQTFIEVFHLKKNHFSSLIDEYMKEIDNKNITLQKNKEIVDFLENKLKIKYDYEINEQPDIYSECLRLLIERGNCFNFALDKDESEIRNLNEFLGMDENPLLQNDDIQSFGKVVPFINSIYEQCRLNDYNDEIIYEYFKKQLHDDDYLLKCFKEYINKYGLLENLYNEYLNKPEVSKTKIFSIINDSKIEIENYFEGESTINVRCKYKGDKKDKEINITFDELNELRDRALISNPNNSFPTDNKQNINDLNKLKEKEHLENSQIFLNLVGYIKKLINYMEELTEKGYPKRIKIIIETKNKKISANYSSYEKDNKGKIISINIEELINHLENLFKEQKESLLNICKKEPLMRFFYGKQFFLLSKYIDNFILDIIDKDIKKESILIYEQKVIALLTYLTDVKYFQKFDMKILKDTIQINELNEIDKNLLKISKYLELFFLQNNITLEKILSKNKLNNNKLQGFYIVEVFENSYEIEILNWYYRLTKNLPLSFTLLFCNNETSEEELTSFLYRVFFCEYNILFLIQGVEDLSDNNRKIIISFLRDGQLMENLKSTLFITYKKKDSDIYKSMMKINGAKELTEFENKKLNNKIECKSLLKNIYIVNSNASGVGKSFYIKKKAKESQLKYIYFSFGGAFTKESIIRRLNELKKSFSIADKALFHLDLLETDNDYLTRDIIFSLTILKKYGYNDNIVFFPKEFEIYIELPFGFTDFKKRFELLSAFKEIKLDINNLPELVEKSGKKIKMIIDSDIQIVSSVLELFENNTIYNTTVNLYSQEIKNMSRCQDLIKKYFDIPNANYYQIDSFIRIMSYQFRNFIESIYFSIDVLMVNNLLNIRTFMIKSLIEITKSFIQGVFNKIVSSQSDMQKFQNSLEDNIQNRREIALKALTSEQEMISFEKFKPSLIFFNEDKESLSIITSCDQIEEEYKNLERLYNSQIQGGQIINKLLDYRNMNSDEILGEIQKVLNINNVSLEELKYYSNSYVFTADNFIKLILILTRVRANIPVVMMGETGCGKTSLLRVLSKLQNHGELKMKIKNIHAGIEEEDIVTFIDKVENDLENEINEIMAIEQINFYENKKEYELNKKKFYDEFEYFEKFRNDLPKLWVFFDEINTCDCLGLLSEILCHHSCRGKKIRDDIIFFAACNPYRLITKQIEEVGLLNKKKHKKRNYVYSVNPLPHSLLNFVFDFGNLKKGDEYKYIVSIVTKTFETYERKINNINKYKNLINIASKCISLCQNFIREYNDVSSVSLREIRRFDLLFHWFLEYFDIKKTVFSEIKEENNKMNIKSPEYIDIFISKNFEELCKDSINLSLYMCYFIRISDKKLRKKLSHQLDSSFKFGFLTIPKEESLYIANNVNLERGTAKNEALLENLFSLFVCIQNQIPLFIVGKPGTSKSMSVQIMYNSMKGRNSSNLLFKKFKSLYLYPYQGSETSTSKGVLNIFNKAREPIKRNIEKGNEIDFIPAVFFDEMGLAENSVNNPLKVIHSQLEYDENEFKVSFIGISNWVLDSSKMNRGISLLIPQPDLNDLIDTAKKIAQSYDKNILERYDSFFEILSKTYYNYKDKIKNTKYEDFHGNRDFYHLIKIAAKKIVKYEESKKNKKILENKADNSYENKIIEEICISSLERNFGGFNNSINIIKDIFYSFYPNKTVKRDYNVLECIKENLEDKESRYLLLVSKSSISNYLLNLIFNKMNIKYNFYLGSKFKDEHEGEDYSVKMLNKIQLQMEAGGTLVLQNLEIIYPSLYDLFNQNFTKMGNKNYARIAFSSNKSYSLVDNSFKVIILVEKENILKEEPPFLNRFEKHEISFEYLLNKIQNSWANYIYSLIKETVKLKSDVDLKKQLINCSLDEIQGLIYNYCKNQLNNKKISLDEIIKYTFNKIVPIFSQDIIASISINGFETKYPDIAELIYKIYNKKKNNLKNFLINTNRRKNIVFTFSNPIDPIFIDKNINNENSIEQEEKVKCNKLGYINDSKTNKIFISSLKSEKNFERQIKEFYNNKSQNLCLLKFSENELNQLSHINFLVDSSLKDLEIIEKKENNLVKVDIKSDNKRVFYFVVHSKKNEDNINKSKIEFNDNINEENFTLSKNILIIVYLTRHFKSDNINIKSEENESPSMISFLSDYNQIFIDNLEAINLNFLDFIHKDIGEKILKNIDLDKIMKNKIFPILSRFKYKIKGVYRDINSKNYINNITSKILNNSENIKDLFKEYIIKFLKEKNNAIRDLFDNKNGNFQRDGDFISSILYYFEKEINDYLLHLIFYFEKKQILLTKLLKNEFYLKFKEIQNYIEYLINNYFQNKNKENEISVGNNIGILILNLNIPNIRTNFIELGKYINEEILDEYLNNDQSLIKLRNDQIIREEQINIKSEEKRKIKELIINGEKLKRNLEEKINNKFKTITLFQYISEKNNSELIEIFFEDYLNYFIYKNFDYSEHSIYLNFLKILLFSINIRKNPNYYMEKMNENNNIEQNKFSCHLFQKETENFNHVLHYITICEIYSENIIELFSLIKIIIQYFNIFDCDKLFNIIIKNKIKLIYAYKIYEEKEKNDERFYIIIESLIIYIYEEIKEIIKLDESTFYEFLRELITISESLEQLFIYFSINSVNVYNIKILSQIIKDILNHPEIDISKICEILNETIFYFEKERIILEENKESDKIKELIQILRELIDYLKIIFPNEKNEIEIYIYQIQVNKIKNLFYIQEIFSLIFKNQDLIPKSEQFIKYFLPKKDLIPPFEENKDCFMKIFKKEKDNLQNNNKLFLSEINKNQSPAFEETILFYFNKILNEYFMDLELYFSSSKTKTYDSFAFNYFALCLENLRNINEFSKYELNYLAKLYSISYIRNYLYNYVRIITDNKLYNEFSFSSVNNLLNKSKKDDHLIGVLIIYIFKLIYFANNKNFDLFLDFMMKEFREKYLFYFTKFDFGQKHKDSQNYLLLNLDNIHQYESLISFFIQGKKYDFSNFNIIEKINDLDNKEDIIDLLFCLISNYLLCDFIGINQQNHVNSLLFNNFLRIIKELIQENILKINKPQNKLLNLILEPELIFNKIIRKYGKINSKRFDIIAYSIRFLLSIHNKINFYTYFFHEDTKNYINSYYIPGTFMELDLFLMTLQDIEKHLNKEPMRCGCYVCSCGYYYPIPPCGYPYSESDCPYCHMKIGGLHHKLIKREGHMRIYKNINDLNENGGYNGGSNKEHLSCAVMTLDDYKNNVINKRPSLDYKGIKKEYKNNFKRTQVFRNINPLTYRILHFMLYSHLFFSNALEFLNDNELNDYCVDGMNCMEILEDDWSFIEECLKEKGISKIQIFFNYIFKEFINEFQKSGKMDTVLDRNNFEKKINEFLGKKVKKEEYKEYEELYLRHNIKPVGDLIIKGIIEEILKPSEYSEIDFPYLKYFYYQKEINKDEIYIKLKSEKNYNIRYPLLEICLSKEGFEKAKLLQNLQNINNFSNILLKQYSYKLTREEAKKIKIGKVLKNQKMENLFEKYVDSWNNIKQYAIKYECRNEMEVLNINKDSPLSQFLLDNGELYFGMYLAAAYDMFIDWQNSIINEIINVNSQNGLLKSYINILSRKVFVQEANDNDIISIGKYKENQIFYKVLNKYIYRNCFEKDKEGKLNIDYFNYDGYIYDFDKMEIELGKLFLFGKKKFITKEENRNNYLNFITYRFEGFRNNKSSIITEFNAKYQSKELSQHEKEEILRFLNSKNIINIDTHKIRKMKDLEDIYFSSQTLLFYIFKEDFKINKSINDIIVQLPEYIFICKELKNFFNIYQNFCVDSILKFFENIEVLCFGTIRQNLNEEYKNKIDLEMQNQIINYVSNNKNGIILISKNFSEAIRKLISRYLAGKRSENEINEEQELKLYIVVKEDLWDTDPSKDEELQKILEEFFGYFPLKVGQSLALYDLLNYDNKILYE